VSEQEHESELTERVDALADWVKELEAQLRASTAVADSRALKELAKALEAWNKHDPKLEKRLTERVDVLADRFATLAGTVNTTAASLAGKDGEIANLRRALEEGNARIESVVSELRQLGTGSDVAELRRAVAELSSERRTRSGDPRVDTISSEVDVLAQRLDTLSKTVSTTAAGLSGREGELITLRAHIEESEARATALASELQESLGALSSQMEALAERPDDPDVVHRLEGRLDALAQQVLQIALTLDGVSTDVGAAMSRLAAGEDDLAELGRRFEVESHRVDGMVAELQATVSALPVTGAIEGEIEDRLLGLARQIDDATEHVAQLEVAMSAQWREGASSAAALDHTLVEVTRQIADLERGREEAAADLGRTSDAWFEERAWVRDQLQQLTAVVESAPSTDAIEPRLRELASRVETMELGQQAVGTEVSRIGAAWDAERSELRDALDALASTVNTAQPVPGGKTVDDDVADLLAELGQRLDVMEQEQATVVSELARVHALSTSAPARAEDTETAGRVDELARRLESLELDRGANLDSPVLADELRDLRVLMNGLRMRLTSSEKELAVLSSHGDIASRLDDLGLRLASLERSVAYATSSPVPGDGRFRVELRGLDQRMEQLEAAARENRDAVLMQFERLATRLQYRLQQLEEESVDAGYSTKASPGAVGQVVPIRGES
jgi:chromosome segregation ATPase